MVLNNLFPIFTLLVAGALIKRFNLSNDAFHKTADRLVYYIFFPTLLFWKIGGGIEKELISFQFCIATIICVAIIFCLSTLYIKISHVSDYTAGAFSQSCYRFNTYIGMAIVMNAMGPEGVRLFAVTAGFLIPIINVLAVFMLIWFSGKRVAYKQRIQIAAKEILTNPLIIACVAGFIYSGVMKEFPVFIDNSLHLASLVTLPLALLSVGAALTFKDIKSYIGLSMVAACFKLILSPLIGFGLYKLFSVTHTAFNVGMIYFALPTSTAIYVLSSQLNSDTKYASAAIVVSTIFSFVSLSFILWLSGLNLY